MNIIEGKIINEPFKYNGKLICKKQRKVNIDGKELGRYGCPTSEEIYEAIKLNNEIYFPKCFIPEIIIYSKKYNDKDERIELSKIDLSWSIFVGLHTYQFRDIKVNGIVDFRGAQFINVHCLFNNCNFEVEYKGNPTIDFTGIECYRSYIKFNVNIIDSHFNFSGSTIKESTIEFNKINIQHLTNRVSELSTRLDFYGLSLDNRSRIKIISSRIETMIDFRFNDWQGDVSLINVDLEKCKHIDFWNNSINGSFDAIGLSKQIIRCINNSIIDHKNVEASILLMLKNNSAKLGYFDDEDNLYVAYRRYRAKDQLKGNKKEGILSKLNAYMKYYFNLIIFDIPGEYGTRLGNVALTMLNTVFFFSFLYYSFPSLINFKGISFSSNYILNRLAGSVYHSMITFLTIGYGDVAPKSLLGGVISGFEGFLGLFLMAYITIAFSRKVLR